jgi:hypothetical protein
MINAAVPAASATDTALQVMVDRAPWGFVDPFLLGFVPDGAELAPGQLRPDGSIDAWQPLEVEYLLSEVSDEAARQIVSTAHIMPKRDATKAPAGPRVSARRPSRRGLPGAAVPGDAGGADRAGDRPEPDAHAAEGSGRRGRHAGRRQRSGCGWHEAGRRRRTAGLAPQAAGQEEEKPESSAGDWFLPIVLPGLPNGPGAARQSAAKEPAE